MILAAGLTPAWQQVLDLDVLELGAVNRARDVLWCSSGKVLNVAIALAHLGAPVETVALVGGPPRDLIEREFASLGIARRWVPSHWATRVCTTIMEAHGRTTELVENAGPVTADELDEFQRVFIQAAAAADAIVLTGSLPRGTPTGYYRRLLEGSPANVILDARGPELIEALQTRPFLVKPNRQELSQTLGKALDRDDALREAMRELNVRGARWAVVTNGGQDTWASCEGKFFRLRPPEVQVINPIGSGDSMAAAIAWAVVQGTPPIDAIRLGVAAGAENAAEKLPGRLDPRAVARLAQAVSVEAL